MAPGRHSTAISTEIVMHYNLASAILPRYNSLMAMILNYPCHSSNYKTSVIRCYSNFYANGYRATTQNAHRGANGVTLKKA